MKVTVITLFPPFFESPLTVGLLGKALERGLVDVKMLDLRPYGEGRHRTVDDAPYGGGAGMVLKAVPVVEAIEEARKMSPGTRVILLTPQGKRFDHRMSVRLAEAGDITLVCGRYEGFDERIRAYVDEEVSIGDYILMGGEAAALAIIESAARHVPGVLGDERSAQEDSLAEGMLEYPQYTRPREFRGEAVPEILLSGDHARIAAWRAEQSRTRTEAKRPDLLDREGAEDGDEG